MQVFVFVMPSCATKNQFALVWCDSRVGSVLDIPKVLPVCCAQREAAAFTMPRMTLPHTFGISGWSGSGKTTLIELLIPLFRAQGLRVSLIKHTHHGFDVDKPGKDSFRFREAGATEVILAGSARWALMHELREAPQAGLAELLSKLSACDLVLVEGFKSAELPKIEVHRPSVGKPFFHAEFPNVVAVASDEALSVDLPVLDLNDAPAIAAWILAYLERA